MPKTRKKSPVFKARKTIGMHHDPEILFGMSRGPWANLWGTAEEEAGAREVDTRFVRE